MLKKGKKIVIHCTWNKYRLLFKEKNIKIFVNRGITFKKIKSYYEK